MAVSNPGELQRPDQGDSSEDGRSGQTLGVFLIAESIECSDGLFVDFKREDSGLFKLSAIVQCTKKTLKCFLLFFC